MTKRFAILLLLLISLVGGSFAQTNPSRDELQKQEQGLRKELDELNELKNQIQKNKKTTLAQLNVIKSKIAKREALVNGIAKQVALIDNTIATNQKDVSRLNSELDTLKSRYAKSISFAYKNRSGYEYLNFLFSANSFNDAVKRITYLKNYRQNREAQAKTIALSQLDLNDKISQLGLNKKDFKEKLIDKLKELPVADHFVIQNASQNGVDHEPILQTPNHFGNNETEMNLNKQWAEYLLTFLPKNT